MTAAYRGDRVGAIIAPGTLEPWTPTRMRTLPLVLLLACSDPRERPPDDLCADAALDDGKLLLRATRVGGGIIETEVIYGGKLSDKKGVSLPDTLPADARRRLEALAASDRTWRHEADVYRAGLDDVLPAGMRVPRRERSEGDGGEDQQRVGEPARARRVL